MDTIVYFILIVLAIPLFFMWRAIFRRYIKTEKTRIIATWLTTIVSAPVLYACIILLFLSAIEYYPNRDFNKQDWMDNPDRRFELSKDIIKSKMLLGKNYKEVMQILGEVGNDTSSQIMYYYLGYEPTLMNTHPSTLFVEFGDGKVIKVSQHSD